MKLQTDWNEGANGIKSMGAVSVLNTENYNHQVLAVSVLLKVTEDKWYQGQQR